MRRIWMRMSIGLLVSVLSCATVFSQATAQIGGAVKDQSGAVLPGAEVTATQTETGATRSAVSNETGSYVLSNLAIGPYKLEVSLPGFRTYVRTGIVLQVNSNPTIDAILEVGQVSEQVEVQANASLVETRSVGVGQVIENERILELPLNGRQATDLIVLAGSAVQTGTSTSRSMQGGVAVSVAGGLSSGVAYILDGAMHNDPTNNLNLPLPFPDALQEFKVETSGLSAQNGMHGGAAVNSVTKSGSNELHGDLFEFVRNGKFNARNTFATKRDSLKRNQFGGTLGGPIARNKLFFFGGYQGTITRSDPPETIRFLPTAAMLAGDFTTVASTACRPTALTLRAPFVGNRVDPALFSPAAKKLVTYLPKTDDPCGRIVYGVAEKPNELQAIGKIDYQRSASHSIFGRFIETTYKRPPPLEATDNVLVSTTGGRDNLAQAYTIGDTHLIGPNVVNAVRLAVNRTAIRRSHKDMFSAADLGIPVYSCQPKYMLLTVSNNGPSIGGGTENNSTFRTTTYQIAEDLSVVKGNHQMSFGANLAYWRQNFNANVRCIPGFSFDGSATGLPLGDLLTGKLTTLTQAEPNVLYMSQWYLGAYGQDTWKATPRLTLNYGVRWEPYLPQNVTNGHIYSFSEERFNKGIKSTVFTKAPAGFYFPGDPGFVGKSGIDKRWMTFGPRVGLAWDVRGDGKTSVRASYGMAFDFPVGEFHLNTSIAPPWGAETRIPAPAGGFDNPYRDWPGGNPFPYTFNANTPFTVFGPFLPMRSNIKMPTIQTWNLSIQRQIGTSWFVSTSYLGNQSYHLWQTKALNAPVYLGLGPCTLNNVDAQGRIVPQNYTTCSTTNNLNNRRKYFLQNPQEGQYIGFLDEYDDGGTQSYDGLQLNVQRRARNVTISGNYTWSHCLGDANGLGGTPNVATNYHWTDNRDKDRGNCGSDRRQIFNFTSVAETPQFANSTLRAVAGGWRLSAIYRKSSGNYLTLSTGTDVALNGFGSQRPNQILGNPYGDKSVNFYLNPAAFAPPASGTLGNMSPRNILGVGSWQFDTALSRTFRVKESQRLEFRAEAFNVLNGVRYNNPSTAINSNQFGRISTADDPRIMQFALKYVF